MRLHQVKLRGVGRWRPALLFILLPTLVALSLWVGTGAVVQAQEPSPTFALEQVTLPALPPSAAFGRGSYEQNCAPCHGVTGLGDGPTAPSLPYSPTQFADPAAIWALSPAEMFHTTKFGRVERLMPPWQNQLTDDEIWQTVMYAWSLQTDPMFVAGGETLYAAQCAACHGATGAGDGPDAPVDLVDFSDPAYAITQSQADWLASWQAAHPEFGEGWREEEQRQVLEYIRTFSYVPAWESGYRAGPGIINGMVTQGTAGETLPPGLVVTLDAYQRFALVESFTTTVDDTGYFTFTDLSVDANISYLAAVEFDGVRYGSGLVMLTAAAPEATTEIVVYATTDVAPEIRIDRLDWIIDDDPGALLVAQVYYFGSAGDHTFVGAPVNGVEMPVTVAIQVPVGAEQVTFEGGLVGGRFQRGGTRYYDTAPLIPGEGTKQILVRYLLPYDGTNFEYFQELLYPTREVNLLVAELPQLEVTITPRDRAPWEVIETQDFQGRSYRLYRAGDLPPTVIDIALNGLLAAGAVDPRAEAGTTAAGGTGTPGAAIAPAPFVPWMAWSVGGVSLLMLAGGLVWAWRGGRMQLAERPRDLRAEMEAVARRIAQLDDRYALGQLDRVNWQHQRSQLKTHLLEIARLEMAQREQATPTTQDVPSP